MKGIDLQARNGFVFIAPTVRPSKDPDDEGELRPYTWVSPVHWNVSPWIQEPSRAFAELPWAVGGAEPAANGSRRREPRELMREALAAETGGRRPALLALVQEWEMRDLPPEAIKAKLRKFLPRVPSFDPDKPWYPARNPDAARPRLVDRYRGGRYWRNGKPIIPDATDDEMDGIKDAQPIQVGRETPPEEEAFWTSREDLRIRLRGRRHSRYRRGRCLAKS